MEEKLHHSLLDISLMNVTLWLLPPPSTIQKVKVEGSEEKYGGERLVYNWAEYFVL